MPGLHHHDGRGTARFDNSCALANNGLFARRASGVVKTSNRRFTGRHLPLRRLHAREMDADATRYRSNSGKPCSLARASGAGARLRMGVSRTSLAAGRDRWTRSVALRKIARRCARNRHEPVQIEVRVTISRSVRASSLPKQVSVGRNVCPGHPAGMPGLCDVGETRGEHAGHAGGVLDVLRGHPLVSLSL